MALTRMTLIYVGKLLHHWFPLWIVACLFVGRPLPEPMSLDLYEQTSMNQSNQHSNCHLRKWLLKYHLQRGGHFISASMCHTNLDILQRILPGSPVYDTINLIIVDIAIQLLPILETRARNGQCITQRNDTFYVHTHWYIYIYIYAKYMHGW